MFASTTVSSAASNIFEQAGCEASVCPEESLASGEEAMKQPMIGKQFSLCPDTGELEASRRSQEKQRQQQEQAEGLVLTDGHSFVGTDLVDPKLLASLSFDNLDLKLEDPTAHELLVEHVVKSEGGGGGDHYTDAVALAALSGNGAGNNSVDMDSSPTHAVKREPGSNGSLEDEMHAAKVRRVMVNDATIQQLLNAAGQGGDRAVSLAVDPRLLNASQQQQVVHQTTQPQSQQQTRFLIAWKAENNELVPVCIPVQTGSGGGGQRVQLSDGTTIQMAPGTDLMSLTGQSGQTQVLSGVSSPQHQQLQQPAQTVHHSPQPHTQQQVQQFLPVSGTTQGTIIQLPANNIIPALAQGATLQIPAGSAFPGLSQALQIPSSGILHAAGSQGTVLQLPSGINSSDGATLVQLPSGHFSQQQHQQVMIAQGDGSETLGPESIVIKEDHDLDVGESQEEVVTQEKGLNLATGSADDVTSSSVGEVGPTSNTPAQSEEPELETTEEDQDSESWRLRHAVTILEKSQINFLRDARRSFKCYQCGGLIRPPALEVEVDLAPYGIRPVLCTDCGKFHLNKRNVNVRVTTDEGCEQLHRFMSA